MPSPPLRAAVRGGGFGHGRGAATPSVRPIEAYRRRVIRLENLRKAFGGRPAVEGLTVEVPRGAIHGLLGHNGAGKSTTLGMLLGQVHPDAGRALVDGHDVASDRAGALGKVGAIFEAPCFYDYLSARKNLRAFSNLTRRVSEAEIDAVVERVGLKERIHAKVSTYSHGMRQRLALAQALLPTPEVLILDEPTDGLDPQGIAAFRELLLEAARRAEPDDPLQQPPARRGGEALRHRHRAAPRQARLRGRLEGRDRERPPPRPHRRATARPRLSPPSKPPGSSSPQPPESADRDSEEPETVTVRGDRTFAETNAHLVHAGFAVSAFAPIAPTLEAFYLDKASESEASST